MLPILFINLAKSLDRRQEMEERLASLGLRGERIEAVTPDNIAPTLLQRFCRPNALSLSWVTPAELACTMSHRKAWSLVTERNLSAALVLEDDAILSSRLVSALSTLNLDGADVVDLYAGPLPVTIEPGMGLRKTFTFNPGTVGYVVTANGAAKLLKGRNFAFPVDHLMFDPRGPMFDRLVIRQMVPALCTVAEIAEQSAPSSDIGDRSERESMLQVRRKMPHALFRRLLSRVKEEVRERAARKMGAVRRVVPFEA